MIKALNGSKLVRNLAATAMLTAGVLTTNGLKAKTKANMTIPNQTEVVTHNTSQALKAYAAPITQTPQKTMLGISESEEDEILILRIAIYEKLSKKNLLGVHNKYFKEYISLALFY